MGIFSDAPVFSKIKIEPHLGNLKNIAGEIPHPNGKNSVRYAITKGQVNAEINLLNGTTGTFVWKGKSYSLKEGLNNIATNL